LVAAEQKPARFSRAKPVSDATVKSFHTKSVRRRISVAAL
jgi:hypothetical protein